MTAFPTTRDKRETCFAPGLDWMRVETEFKCAMGHHNIGAIKDSLTWNRGFQIRQRGSPQTSCYLLKERILDAAWMAALTALCLLILSVICFILYTGHQNKRSPGKVS